MYFFKKLELGFWTYGLIRLLGPSGPNIVSRPQTPKPSNFLRFNNSIGFILWFWKIWSPLCEHWSEGSGLMTRYVF